MASRTWRVAWVAPLTCLWLSGPLAAAPINHGDFDDLGGGGTVIYEDVSEDSATDPVPLYGSPIVVGNLINFSPINFKATSIFGGPADETDGTLTMQVRSVAATHIESIGFSEAGDYTLELLFGSSAGTDVSIEADYTIEVLEIDGAAPTIPVTITGSLSFTPASAFTLPGDAGAGISWIGSAFEDIQTAVALSGNSVVGGATLLAVELNNMLRASSDAGTIASIAKKNLGLSLAVNNAGPPGTQVPEPSTLVLCFLFASLAMPFAWWRCRVAA